MPRGAAAYPPAPRARLSRRLKRHCNSGQRPALPSPQAPQCSAASGPAAAGATASGAVTPARSRPGGSSGVAKAAPLPSWSQPIKDSVRGPAEAPLCAHLRTPGVHRGCGRRKPSELGIVTLAAQEIPICGEGATREEAVVALVDAALDYCDVYQDRIELFSHTDSARTQGLMLKLLRCGANRDAVRHELGV